MAAGREGTDRFHGQREVGEGGGGGGERGLCKQRYPPLLLPLPFFIQGSKVSFSPVRWRRRKKGRKMHFLEKKKVLSVVRRNLLRKKKELWIM